MIYKILHTCTLWYTCTLLHLFCPVSCGGTPRPMCTALCADHISKDMIYACVYIWRMTRYSLGWTTNTRHRVWPQQIKVECSRASVVHMKTVPKFRMHASMIIWSADWSLLIIIVPQSTFYRLYYVLYIFLVFFRLLQSWPKYDSSSSQQFAFLRCNNSL